MPTFDRQKNCLQVVDECQCSESGVPPACTVFCLESTTGPVSPGMLHLTSSKSSFISSPPFHCATFPSSLKLRAFTSWAWEIKECRERRNDLFQVRAHQLVIQYQVCSPENMHNTRNIMQPEQVILRNICAYTHRYVTTINGKRGQEIERDQVGIWEYLEGDREWRNSVAIVLQSQKQEQKGDVDLGLEM